MSDKGNFGHSVLRIAGAVMAILGAVVVLYNAWVVALAMLLVLLGLGLMKTTRPPPRLVTNTAQAAEALAKHYAFSVEEAWEATHLMESILKDIHGEVSAQMVWEGVEVYAKAARDVWAPGLPGVMQAMSAVKSLGVHTTE